jgi:hypothetical protein
LTSGLRYLSRIECTLDSTVAGRERGYEPTPSSATAAAEEEAAIRATPPHRPPGAMAQQESNRPRAHDGHTVHRTKATFFSLAMRSVPPTDFESRPARATTTRDREELARDQNQGRRRRRRAVTSVLPSPSTWTEWSGAGPRLRGLPLASPSRRMCCADSQPPMATTSVQGRSQDPDKGGPTRQRAIMASWALGAVCQVKLNIHMYN